MVRRGKPEAADTIRVRDVVLPYSQIGDISPLSNLTSLDVLNLWGNPISDITPLSGLIGLRSLSIGDCGLSDISSIANLTDLRDPTITSTQIGDISVLESLTKLEQLNLGDKWGGNQIREVSLLIDDQQHGSKKQ